MEVLALFYLIYPLNLVEFGVLELQEKWVFHYPESKLDIRSIDSGGVLIQVTVLQGFSLNHILRSPTRILLRVAEFKARDFPKLFQKISKIKWKDLLIGQSPNVSASANNSRLFDSRKIEKAIRDGVSESYRQQPVKKKYLDHMNATPIDFYPEIYYRGENDTITLSLDTTGELLHKRGEKIYTGNAPIRENLASLLLNATTKNLPHGNYVLIDPMTGSGTFLIEAYDAYQINISRSFAYQHTPLWINYQFKEIFLKKMLSRENPLIKEFIGCEIDDDVYHQALKNISSKNIRLIKTDFFTANLEKKERNLVIINPPYGVRVGEKSNINLGYYKEIVQKVFEKTTPKRLGIIIPEEYNFQASSNEKLIARIPFKNGGLSVVFYLLTSKESS